MTDTTRSAREILPHLRDFHGDPYIPEIHDDEPETPPTDERLAEIRESIPVAYPAPWTASCDLENDRWVIRYTTDNPLAGLVAEVPDYGAHIAQFIETARTAVPELLAEVERLRARVAELEQIETNAWKLVSGWLRASAEHFSISNLDAVKHRPLFAGIQDGRANQYSDCANELRDILDGEDPDGWTFKVGINVAPAADATEAGEQG